MRKLFFISMRMRTSTLVEKWKLIARFDQKRLIIIIMCRCRIYNLRLSFWQVLSRILDTRTKIFRIDLHVFYCTTICCIFFLIFFSYRTTCSTYTIYSTMRIQYIVPKHASHTTYNKEISQLKVTFHTWNKGFQNCNADGDREQGKKLRNFNLNPWLMGIYDKNLKFKRNWYDIGYYILIRNKCSLEKKF